MAQFHIFLPLLATRRVLRSPAVYLPFSLSAFHFLSCSTSSHYSLPHFHLGTDIFIRLCHISVYALRMTSLIYRYFVVISHASPSPVSPASRLNIHSTDAIDLSQFPHPTWLFHAFGYFLPHLELHSFNLNQLNPHLLVVYIPLSGRRIFTLRANSYTFNFEFSVAC